MIPIRVSDPVGAIGAYWASPHRATSRELTLLESLASASAVAIHNGELLADARRAARVREDFLAIASHEIRTPLAAMILNVGSLERALRWSEPLDREGLLVRVEGLARGGKRLNSLVEQLLETTRMMSGQVVLVQTRFDLTALVRRIVDQFAETAARAKCELRVELPRTLPIEGDEERLGVAVSNLLSNAIKYGAEKPIDLTLEALPIGARLSVRDRGIGIAKKDHGRIFDPFERAVSTQNYGGFGVGLWAARRMIEAHGGRIELSSELGMGALFVIELGSPNAHVAATLQ